MTSDRCVPEASQYDAQRIQRREHNMVEMVLSVFRLIGHKVKQVLPKSWVITPPPLLRRPDGRCLLPYAAYYTLFHGVLRASNQYHRIRRVAPLVNSTRWVAGIWRKMHSRPPC